MERRRERGEKWEKEGEGVKREGHGESEREREGARERERESEREGEREREREGELRRKRDGTKSYDEELRRPCPPHWAMSTTQLSLACSHGNCDNIYKTLAATKRESLRTEGARRMPSRRVRHRHLDASRPEAQVCARVGGEGMRIGKPVAPQLDGEAGGDSFEPFVQLVPSISGDLAV